MEGFSTYEDSTYEYDQKRDGVWLIDEHGDRFAFFPRRTIIELVSYLASA